MAQVALDSAFLGDFLDIGHSVFLFHIPTHCFLSNTMTLHTWTHPPAALRACLFLMCVVWYSSSGFLYFEHCLHPSLTWSDALWWTFSTMTTVGFGDVSPVTWEGRFLIGLPTMLVGAGMMGYALTQIAVFLIRAETITRQGFTMAKPLPNTLVVCNYPSHTRFSQVLKEIRAQPDFQQSPVVLIDEHLTELGVEYLQNNVQFIKGHPARAHTLERAHIQHASRVVILARAPNDPTSDTLSMAICLTLKHLKPHMHVVAECVDPENEELLIRAGCHSVVCMTNLTPSLLAHELYDPGLVAVLQELAEWNDRLSNVYMVPVTSSGSHTLEHLRAWALAHNTTLLGIKNQHAVTLNPPHNMVLPAHSTAIVVCDQRPQNIVL